MDRYRMDRFPVEFYLDQVREDRVTIEEPAGEPAQGCLTLSYGAEEMEVDLYFPLEDGVVTPDSVQAARDVLSVIDVLDARARQVPSPEDHEEHLAYVVIAPTQVQLHYFATTVNTEWGAYFTRGADGSWQFDGLG